MKRRFRIRRVTKWGGLWRRAHGHLREEASDLMTWNDITRPGIPLVLTIAALLIAVIQGRSGRRFHWMTFFAQVGILLACAFTALSLLAAWLHWKQIDDWQQSEVDAASSVTATAGQGHTVVELVFPNGTTGRMIRFDFDLPIVESTQWGVVLAIAVAALAVLVRSFVSGRVHEQRKRNSQCTACGYSLTGASGRTCPECGEATQ